MERRVESHNESGKTTERGSNQKLRNQGLGQNTILVNREPFFLLRASFLSPPPLLLPSTLCLEMRPPRGGLLCCLGGLRQVMIPGIQLGLHDQGPLLPLTYKEEMGRGTIGSTEL